MRQVEKKMEKLLERATHIEATIQETINTEVKKFCDKWGVEFKAGMGTHFFQFINPIELLCKDDNDAIDTIDSRVYFPDDKHRLEGVSEFNRMFEDWQFVEELAEKAGEALDKNCSDWFLDGANDCKGHTPNETKRYTRY